MAERTTTQVGSLSRGETCLILMRRRGITATAMAKLLDPPTDTQRVTYVLRPAHRRAYQNQSPLRSLRILTGIERILGVEEGAR